MCLILIIVIQSALAIQFSYKLPKREIVCFGDQVTEGIIIRGEVEANFKDFSLKINNPIRFKKEGFLHQSSNELTQKFYITSQHNHSIQMCIQNLHTFDLIFTLKYSIETIVDKTQINKPLETVLAKMRGYLPSIQSTFQSMKNKQERKLEQFQQLNTKMLFLSVSVILSTILLTYLVARRYKKIISNRKQI